LLPLALQNSAMYSPLAWVIIGGLLSSTFIARIVTPAIYKLLPPAIEATGDYRGMIEIWPSRSRIA
jgi:Cu/Ag efflux pump CusA